MSRVFGSRETKPPQPRPSNATGTMAHLTESRSNPKPSLNEYSELVGRFGGHGSIVYEAPFVMRQTWF